MKIKLFGKDIFEFKKNSGSQWFEVSQNSLKESKYLPDFYETNNYQYQEILAYVDSDGIVRGVGDAKKGKKKDKKPKVTFEITPKGVHELKFLNDDSFKINAEPKYIDDQLSSFKDKLGIIKTTENDMSLGIKEISSIISRLENRKKYPEFKKFFEDFAYTTNEKIGELIKVHSHLKIGKVEQFLADMPNEATKVMKDYTRQTELLCGKKPLFYIIANKRDFQKTEKRRDPILLAQSPFGHVWQILGAWDEEMLLLDEL